MTCTQLGRALCLFVSYPVCLSVHTSVCPFVSQGSLETHLYFGAVDMGKPTEILFHLGGGNIAFKTNMTLFSKRRNFCDAENNSLLTLCLQNCWDFSIDTSYQGL